MWKFASLFSFTLAASVAQASDCFISNKIYVEDSFPSPTTSNCMENCKVTNGCKFWSFNRGQCSLKFFEPGALIKGGGPFIKTGYPDREIEGSGYVLVGNQVKGLANAEECQKRCFEDKQCNSFTFQFNNGTLSTCTFNYGKIRRILDIPSNVTSGPAICNGEFSFTGIKLSRDQRQVEKCPENWAEYGTKCYRKTSAEVIGAEITTGCKALNSKAVPAKIDNLNELNFVDDLRDNTSERVWIDGNDVEKEGTWVSLNGSPITYFNWDAGQPDNYNNNEDCLEIWKSGTNNDEKCSRPQRVICSLSQFEW